MASFHPKLKLCTPREAFKHQLNDLHVGEGDDVLLSPYAPEFADRFAKVAVGSYQDLQTLGFVPRGLAEEQVRKAIAADDREALLIARSALDIEVKGPCECNSHSLPPSAPYGTSFRRIYNTVRNSNHPSLASLLSDHLRVELAWDSPIPGITRKWATTIVGNRPEIVIILNLDITIDRGATLTVDPTARSLYAGSIRIHRTGQLVYAGGYLKIWADSIVRFLEFATVSKTLAEHIPWLSAA